ncbi:MAG: RIO1 family regulatory kinase/ATPase [Thermodesulfobacteriota bacterium]
MFESLQLARLPARHRGVLREPTSTRPVLWIVEEDGVEAVVKDYSLNGFFYRSIIGRFLVWREQKAYRKLKGLKGVPALLRVIDGRALVLQRVDGESLENLEARRRLPKSFFDELEALVREVHRRGLVHCDLKRAPNILVGRDGKPYILDWSASVSRREMSLFPLNHVYERLLSDDFNAITKVQLRHCPEDVSPERKKRYFARGPAEVFVRSIRDRCRELLKRVA